MVPSGITHRKSCQPFFSIFFPRLLPMTECLAVMSIYNDTQLSVDTTMSPAKAQNTFLTLKGDNRELFFTTL